MTKTPAIRSGVCGLLAVACGLLGCSGHRTLPTDGQRQASVPPGPASSQTPPTLAEALSIVRACPSWSSFKGDRNSPEWQETERRLFDAFHRLNRCPTDTLRMLYLTIQNRGIDDTPEHKAFFAGALSYAGRRQASKRVVEDQYKLKLLTRYVFDLSAVEGKSPSVALPLEVLGGEAHVAETQPSDGPSYEDTQSLIDFDSFKSRYPRRK